VGGLAFDASQSHLLDDRQTAADENNFEAFQALDEQIADGQLVDAVLYGAGLLAVVTGVLVLVVDSSSEPTAQLSVGPGPGVGLSYAVDF
jgi:hypothetical protein